MPLDLVQAGGVGNYLARHLKFPAAVLSALSIGLATLYLLDGGTQPHDEQLRFQSLNIGILAATCWLAFFMMRYGHVIVATVTLMSCAIAGVIYFAFVNPLAGPTTVVASLLMISLAMLGLPPHRFRLLIRIFGVVAGFAGVVNIYRIADALGLSIPSAFTMSLMFVVVLGITLVQFRNVQSWLTEALYREVETSAALKHAQRTLAAQVEQRTQELNGKVEELQTAQTRLKLLESVAINAREAIVILEGEPAETNQGRRILFVNDAFTSMFGYSRGEALGSTLRLLRSHEADPEQLDQIRESLDAGRPIRVETPNLHKGGQIVWGEAEYVPVYSAGKIQHWTWVTRDITTRRQAQLEVKEQRDFALQVMHSMVQAIVIVSLPDGKIEYVNPAAEHLAHMGAKDLVGRSISEFVSSELVARLSSPASHHMRGLSQRFESALYGVNGEKIRIMVNAAPRWRKGQVTGIIAILTDLTEQKHTEDALREARDRALEASQVKSQFLATMSHEIRTPMNAVLGMSELLMDSPMEGEQKEMVSVILESSQSLMGLLNDVLEFSKIEANRVELDAHEFDPGAQFDATVDLFSGRAHAKGLTLKRIVVGRLPHTVRADAEKIRRVLSNLISNAIKFTTTGSVEVSIEHVLRDGEPWLKYTVVDTGVGIDPAMRPRIFEPFRQGDNSTTRKFGGTGLGLSISRELVGLMRGEMDFDSEPDRSTTFWFIVPVHDGPEPGG